MQLILVTGLSGSGKSIALNVLEDAGFYCVDNLPADLLAQLAALLAQQGCQRVAIAVDVRSGASFARLPEYLARLRAAGTDLRLLFLDAKTDTLVKRFSETRRRHPLSDERSTLPEAIQRERGMLAGIETLGQRIDTSDLSPNALRAWVRDAVDLGQAGLTVLFQSFGFKHGVPLDADLVFDVRCLPNPNYEPALKPLTGTDPQVIAFLEAQPAVSRMLEDIRSFVERWLPCFVRDNRSYLTVAVGCTGGRHRSVYFVEALARHFRGATPVLVRHRELSA